MRGAKNSRRRRRDLRLWISKFIYLSQTNRFLSTEIESDAEHSKSIRGKKHARRATMIPYEHLLPPWVSRVPSIIIRYFIYLFIERILFWIFSVGENWKNELVILRCE